MITAKEKEDFMRLHWQSHNTMDERYTKWLMPEYNDPLYTIIDKAGRLILGDELSEFFMDVLYQCCTKAFWENEDYELKTINQFIDFIKLTGDLHDDIKN